MTLRRIVVNISCLAIVGLALLLWLTSETIIIKSFSNLEYDKAYIGARAHLNEIDQEFQMMSGNVMDYAWWDDTYSFMGDRNPDYLRSNVAESTFIANRINLLAIIDTKGKIVSGTWYDFDTKKLSSLSKELVDTLNPKSGIVRLRTPRERVNGIIMLSMGPVMISSSPILTSTSQGPARGTMVMGRVMDSDWLKGYKVNIDIDKGVTLHRYKAVVSGLKRGPRDISIKVLDKNRLAERLTLRDVYGKPSLVLEIIRDREVYKHGKKAVRFFEVIYLISGLVILGFMLFFFERIVLRRVLRLTTDISDIAKREDPSMRVSVSGNDELAVLGQSVNQMLESLASSKGQLKESERKYSELFNSIGDPVFINDVSDDGRLGRFIAMNNMACERLDYTRQELINMWMDDICAKDRLDELPGIIVKLFSQGHVTYDMIYVTKIGVRLSVRVESHVSFFQGKKVVFSMVHDTTEKTLADEFIAYQAYYDSLTGLPNRVLMKDKLYAVINQARKEGTSAAVVYIDLDDFKAVNAAMGYNSGDIFLKNVAEILRSYKGEGDTLARMSGDEFVFVFNKIAGELEVINNVGKILEELSKPMVLSGESFSVTASAGIAIYPTHGRLLDSILRSAEAAMYSAKRGGKNTFRLYSTEMKTD